MSKPITPEVGKWYWVETPGGLFRAQCDRLCPSGCIVQVYDHDGDKKFLWTIRQQHRGNQIIADLEPENIPQRWRPTFAFIFWAAIGFAIALIALIIGAAICAPHRTSPSGPNDAPVTSWQAGGPSALITVRTAGVEMPTPKQRVQT